MRFLSSDVSGLPPAAARAEEQLDRVTRAAIVGFDGQPGHREHPFEGHQQPGPAGGEHGQPGTAGEQPFQQDHHAVQQVLAVVQHEQRLPLGQPAEDVVRRRAALTLAEAERVRNRRRDHQRIGHRHQVDVPDAVGEPVSHVGRDTQGQAGLADPARPDGRDQAVLVQRLGQCRPLGHPPDERRQRRRQRGGDRSRPGGQVRRDGGQGAAIVHLELAQQ